MNSGLNHLHNLLAWITLVVISVSVLIFLVNHFTQKKYNVFQNKMRLIAVIVTGVQLILGFVIYFIKDFHKYLGNMDNADWRFKTLEHPLTMLIAIALIHVGSAKIKKASEDKKNKTGLIFFGLSLVFILSRMPWQRLMFQ
jgi:nitric oxide reductase large subunit